MNLSEMFLKELHLESIITLRFLETVPDDRFTWKPHEKSMTLGQLVNHIAELPGWISMMLATKELDFEATPYTPNEETNPDTISSSFRNHVRDAEKALKEAKEEDFQQDWTLRTGSMIHLVAPRWEVIRHTFNQLTHHRAQLGVYFRLLDRPVPSSYGGSADDSSF
ncbi:DinB family protein [Balneolaceae bacterium ANBcel3]|nr:DinB family protein [Balneolaceae bacterium ANBcel3]